MGVMIVALYARVSTSDQSCEMQLRELRQYVQRQGWQVFAEYVDTGFSGASSSRPRLDQLVGDARLQRFEGVLVWKLDRWGRSVAHCVRSIQELVGLGIRFLSPTESIDTGKESPMSRFLLHLFAAFAEMEREIIRERVRAGVRNAKAKGTVLGRPQRVFRRDEALRLRKQGMSWRKLAETEVFVFVKKNLSGAQRRKSVGSRERGAGKGAQPLSPPQHSVIPEREQRSGSSAQQFQL
jgi:putative DNA-invertase from lambdoid prophage Rac